MSQINKLEQQLKQSSNKQGDKIDNLYYYYKDSDILKDKINLKNNFNIYDKNDNPIM